MYSFLLQVQYDNPLAVSDTQGVQESQFQNSQNPDSTMYPVLMTDHRTDLFDESDPDDMVYHMPPPNQRAALPSESVYAHPKKQPVSPKHENIYDGPHRQPYLSVEDLDVPESRPWEQQRIRDLKTPSSLYPNLESDYYDPPIEQSVRTSAQEHRHSTRPLSFPGEFDPHSPVTGGIRVLPANMHA